jgi:hypothetical protein
VHDAAPFYRGRIVGGVLRAETDARFRNRQRAGRSPAFSVEHAHWARTVPY